MYIGVEGGYVHRGRGWVRTYGLEGGYVHRG